MCPASPRGQRRRAELVSLPKWRPPVGTFIYGITEIFCAHFRKLVGGERVKCFGVDVRDCESPWVSATPFRPNGVEFLCHFAERVGRGGHLVAPGAIDDQNGLRRAGEPGARAEMAAATSERSTPGSRVVNSRASSFWERISWAVSIYWGSVSVVGVGRRGASVPMEASVAATCGKLPSRSSGAAVAAASATVGPWWSRSM
jgi:hypothetical protein